MFIVLVAVINANTTELHVFLILLSGNDLGVAFEIPQHVKNQPFFASCVLKVQHHLLKADANNCHANKVCFYFSSLI